MYNEGIPVVIHGMIQELHQSIVGTVDMRSVAHSYLWCLGIDKEVEELIKVVKNANLCRK